LSQSDKVILETLDKKFALNEEEEIPATKQEMTRTRRDDSPLTKDAFLKQSFVPPENTNFIIYQESEIKQRKLRDVDDKEFASESEVILLLNIV